MIRQLEALYLTIDKGIGIDASKQWITYALLFLMLAWLVLKSVCIVCELFARIRQYVQERGFFKIFLSRQQKEERAKRRKFLRVIQSDIDNLSKAENWDDHAFADLEAEVEISGGFFQSALSRLYHNPAHGKKRVRSLLAAIAIADERQLLLIGAPGSGKSVALRHLAHALAERAERTRSVSLPIPLYVNLREFSSNHYPESNADSFQEFVIDNCRRGSPETAAFIRENWQTYAANGGWVFLLDSFDEIGEILHAEQQRKVIERFVEVIRRFAGLVAPCKVVVASREFQSPRGLKWDRLRILPLTFQYQEKLVDRSFLSYEDKKKVVLYLAEERNPLYKNPMFLTLLCRYVAVVKRAPETDVDLLNEHIDFLTKREEAFIRRVYKIEPADLLRGAIELASVFATKVTVGLAPTRRELERMVEKRTFLDARFQEVVGALVECKVLRCDIREPIGEAQRIAFGHRRYQEALFVRTLVAKGVSRNSEMLFESPRWREYLVTLLQGQSATLCAEYLDLAAEIFDRFEKERVDEEVAIGIGGLGNWMDSRLGYLLLVVLEGTSNRPEVVPERLRKGVERFLRNRWNTEDALEKYYVTRLCPLCSRPIGEVFLRAAIASGSEVLEEVAFDRIGLIKATGPDFAHFVRRRYSNGVILANTRAELVRHEAFLSKVTSSFGLDVIYRRSRALNACFSRIMAVFSVVDRGVRGKVFGWRYDKRRNGSVRLDMVPVMSLYLVCLGIGARTAGTVVLWERFDVGLFLAVVLVLSGTALLTMFIFRDEPTYIGIEMVWRRFGSRIWWRRNAIPAAVVAVLLAILVGGPSILLEVICRWQNWKMGLVSVVTIGSFVGLGVAVICGLVARGAVEVRAKRKRDSILKETKGRIVDALLRAGNVWLFESWLESAIEERKIGLRELRQLMRDIGAKRRSAKDQDGSEAFRWIAVAQTNPGLLVVDRYLHLHEQLGSRARRLRKPRV